MLGVWKNYDELEEALSLPELFATLEGVREREKRERQFLAGLKGIDLDKQQEPPDISTAPPELGLFSYKLEDEIE